ncbi:MAG: peptidoglycan-binding domain-containing protein [Candidatus Woesearchaeota archaeon]
MRYNLILFAVLFSTLVFAQPSQSSSQSPEEWQKYLEEAGIEGTVNGYVLDGVVIVTSGTITNIPPGIKLQIEPGTGRVSLPDKTIVTGGSVEYDTENGVRFKDSRGEVVYNGVTVGGREGVTFKSGEIINEGNRFFIGVTTAIQKVIALPNGLFDVIFKKKDAPKITLDGGNAEEQTTEVNEGGKKVVKTTYFIGRGEGLVALGDGITSARFEKGVLYINEVNNKAAVEFNNVLPSMISFEKKPGEREAAYHIIIEDEAGQKEYITNGKGAVFYPNRIELPQSAYVKQGIYKIQSSIGRVSVYLNREDYEKDSKNAVFIGDKIYGKVREKGTSFLVIDGYLPVKYTMDKSGKESMLLGQKGMYLGLSNINYDLLDYMKSKQDVVKLQTFISALGYDIGKVDGILGPKTLDGLNRLLYDMDLDYSLKIDDFSNGVAAAALKAVQAKIQKDMINIVLEKMDGTIEEKMAEEIIREGASVKNKSVGTKSYTFISAREAKILDGWLSSLDILDKYGPAGTVSLVQDQIERLFNNPELKLSISEEQKKELLYTLISQFMIESSGKQNEFTLSGNEQVTLEKIRVVLDNRNPEVVVWDDSAGIGQVVPGAVIAAAISDPKIAAVLSSEVLVPLGLVQEGLDDKNLQQKLKEISKMVCIGPGGSCSVIDYEKSGVLYQNNEKGRDLRYEVSMLSLNNPEFNIRVATTELVSYYRMYNYNIDAATGHYYAGYRCNKKSSCELYKEKIRYMKEDNRLRSYVDSRRT